MKSEGELEKLQARNQELKRKVDDLNMALHDMGRENQNLQVGSHFWNLNLQVGHILKLEHTGRFTFWNLNLQVGSHSET